MFKVFRVGFCIMIFEVYLIVKVGVLYCDFYWKLGYVVVVV